jgi:hypothetical protein
MVSDDPLLRVSMTSDKKKKRRLRDSRLKRARALGNIDPCDPNIAFPPGAIMADQSELDHNNTYGLLPRFYVDRVIVCRHCGREEVWPAERQKWWYEVAKGNINTRAVFCRSCRERGKARKDEARRLHMDGLAKKRDR